MMPHDQDPMEGANMENPEELMAVYRDEAPLMLRVLKTLGTGAFAKVYKAEYQGQVGGLRPARAACPSAGASEGLAWQACTRNATLRGALRPLHR